MKVAELKVLCTERGLKVIYNCGMYLPQQTSGKRAELQQRLLEQDGTIAPVHATAGINCTFDKRQMEDIASVETGKKSRVNDEYDNMDLDDLVDICHGRYFY